MAKKWTQEQLDGFASTDDMHVSPFYSDGKTYGTPTWIWSVVADGNLYVRAYNGKNSRWYKSAAVQKAGRIHLNGQDYEVEFQPVENTPELDKAVSDAYRKKYANSPYLAPMITNGPIQATVRIDPK